MLPARPTRKQCPLPAARVSTEFGSDELFAIYTETGTIAT